jgi:hypothetical protein
MPKRPAKPRFNPRAFVPAPQPDQDTSPILPAFPSFKMWGASDFKEFILKMLGKKAKPRHIRKMMGGMSARQYKKHARTKTKEGKK